MKTRDQMVDEIKAIYTDVARQARDLPLEDRETHGGTLAGLLMALRVVGCDHSVDTLDACSAVRAGVDAAYAYRKTVAS